MMLLDDDALMIIASDLKWNRINTVRGFNIVAMELLNFGCVFIGLYLPSSWFYNIKRRTRYSIALDEIETIIAKYKDKYVYIGGDWNIESSKWCTNLKPVKESIINKKIIKIFDGFLPFTCDLPTFTNAQGNSSCIDMILTKSIKIMKWCTEQNESDHIRMVIYITLVKIPSITNKVVGTKQLILGSWYLGVPEFDNNTSPLTKNHPLVITCRKIINFPNDHGIWRTQKKLRGCRLARLIRRRNKIRRGDFQGKKMLLQSLNITIRKQLKITRLHHIYNNTSSKNQLWSLIAQNIREREKLDWTDEETRKSKAEWLQGFTKNKPVYINQDEFIKGELKSWEINRIKRMVLKTSSLAADNFTNTTWNRFKEKNFDTIITCIRKIFELSVVPNILNVLGCGFVAKKNTRQIRMVKSSSYFMKMIGTIINDRLLSIYDDWMLPDSQFGFGKCNRREFFYKRITDEINLSDGGTTVIKLDVSKAFDQVCIDKTLERLKCYMDKGTIHIIRTMITNRWLTYWDGERKIKLYAKEKSQISQGQPYSPVLFAFTLDFALRRLRNHGIKIFAYADDMIMITQVEKEKRDIMLTRNELWQIGLTLNDKKMERFLTKQTKVMDIIGFLYFPKGYNHTLMLQCFMSDIENIILSIGNVWTKIYKLPGKLRELLISNIIIPKLYKFAPALLTNGRLKAVETIGLMLNRICLNYETKWAWLIVYNYQNVLLNFENAVSLYLDKIENLWKYQPVSQNKIKHLMVDEAETSVKYEIHFNKFTVNSNSMTWYGSFHATQNSIQKRECVLLYNIFESDNNVVQLSKFSSEHIFGFSPFSEELRLLIWKFKKRIILSDLDKEPSEFPQPQIRWNIKDYVTTWCEKESFNRHNRELYIQTFKQSQSPLIYFEWPGYKEIHNPRTKYLLATVTRYKRLKYCQCGRMANLMHHLLCYTNCPNETITKPLQWKEKDRKYINEIILFFNTHL